MDLEESSIYPSTFLAWATTTSSSSSLPSSSSSDAVFFAAGQTGRKILPLPCWVGLRNEKTSFFSLMDR